MDVGQSRRREGVCVCVCGVGPRVKKKIRALK